ncbi:STP1 protein [Plasmodium malariae]|uniref:STP1 protein n=1 Tax=Plasmodium malariae TaxID=5858 RepID=A0A1D3JHI9_PLAMA|nr:STP1 protein [Plasmodium malariae]SBT85814.1 STP1 protein [Plasmodium malariae]
MLIILKFRLINILEFKITLSINKMLYNFIVSSDSYLELPIGLHGFGSSSVQYILNPRFTSIGQHIKKITSSLRVEKNKRKFRKTCLDLADYIIGKSHAPAHIDQSKWDLALKNWYKIQYKDLTRHGECPMIIKQNERNLLELSYEVKDFHEKKNRELNRLKSFLTENNTYSCNNDPACMKILKEYNIWINDRKKYFEGKRELIQKNSSYEQRKLKFSIPINNLLNPEIYSELSEALPSVSVPFEEEDGKEIRGEGKGEDISLGVRGNASENQKSEKSKFPKNSEQPTSMTESDPVEHRPITRGLGESTGHITTIPSDEALKPDSSSVFIIPSKRPDTEGNQYNAHISYILTSFLVIIVFSFFIKYVLIGMFKKKKKIKRREVKFLRILVPSYYNRSKFLRHNHLEHPINEDEEIIKKIKIQEHNMNKNENVLYGKKDRSITIIEVHMEILEECRNKEWEYNKGEFLAICQEVLTKKENGTYTNLKDDEVVMDNIKSTNEIEKQKSLWSKWVERHKMFLEKLRKKDWFNNLKNDWKEERSYIKNSEKLRKYLSNENEKDPFLERKKDIWRRWVSRKGTIVEKYLEEDLFEKLREEIYNMIDTYENEGRKDDILFMNKEELENKENYEVLYKYFKTKLLEKLCILVFMMVLEECKNEEYIENMESHFDNSINECITGKNLDIKPEIEENLTDINGDVLGNIKNNKNYAYEGEDCFREELKEWIRENDAYINSLDSDNNIDECYQVVE